MDIPVAIPKASSDPLPEIAAFLEPFAPLFRRVQSRQSLERYVSGLLTDLVRKNCDTIAAAVAGTSTERLQHLLTDAEWDPQELDASRTRCLSKKSPEGGILVLDETSFPKKGKRSVGVARQYCGELGKVANCQVVVSAQYVADEPGSRSPLHWPVSGRVYLPEEEWAYDPERRKRAHVPAQIGFETKPEIGLSLVDRAREWEVPFEFVVADSGYGDNPRFLEGLEKRKVSYVCAVEGTFGVRKPEEVRAAAEAGAPPYGGMGQPKKPRPAPLYGAKDLLEGLPEEAWVALSWREGTKGTLGKQMAAVRAHRGTGSQRHSTSHSRVSTGAEGWLIGERPLKEEGEESKEGKTKYYFATLPENTPLARLASLAHARWSIEQFYEDAKGECGLGDFQGRRWESVHRHLALVMVAYSFLMVHSTETSAVGEEAFSPLTAAHDAAGDPPSGAGVVAGRPGAVVHRDRPNKDLPAAQKLTK
ncbi:MAG: IS701 family transposase [Rubrobacteraceae bacterium]|nr:IS701 family transposase [Rubrobacteraceae bacterium]